MVGQPASPAAPFQHGIPDCEQRLQAGGLGVPEGKTDTGGGNNYLPLGMRHRPASPYHTSLPTLLFSQSCGQMVAKPVLKPQSSRASPCTGSLKRSRIKTPVPVLLRYLRDKWVFLEGEDQNTGLGIVGTSQSGRVVDCVLCVTFCVAVPGPAPGAGLEPDPHMNKGSVPSGGGGVIYRFRFGLLSGAVYVAGAWL